MNLQPRLIPNTVEELAALPHGTVIQASHLGSDALPLTKQRSVFLATGTEFDYSPEKVAQSPVLFWWVYPALPIVEGVN